MAAPLLASACESRGVPIAMVHQPRVQAALSALTRGAGELGLSDLSFSNLYLFRAAHGYRFVDGNWPHVSGRTYDGTRHLLPLFDLRAVPPGQLQELLGSNECFSPLSQAQVDQLDAERFSWCDVRDDADYLYPAENFRTYHGTLLRKKASLMRQLLARHTLRSERYTTALRGDALAVLQVWMRDKGRAPGEADEAPCIEALSLAGSLGLEGFVHWVDGEPAGFVLAEELQPGVFAMRFAKGLVRCKGIAQYMFSHFCTRFERPVHWLNFEQDLGLQRFRQTKLSYAPQALLRKYRVRLRGDAHRTVSQLAQDPVPGSAYSG